MNSETEPTQGRGRLIGYWATTGFFSVGMILGGVMDIVQPADVVDEMSKLGYPLYFATALGVGKLAGTGVLLAPKLARFKEWAYVAFGIDLIMGSYSHLAVGDVAPKVITPLVIFALMVASYQLRPASRRFGSAAS